MLRKMLVIVLAAAIGIFCLTGCKKESSEPEEAVKATAEYEKEAEEQIDKENMAEELEKIEKTLDEEVGTEQ